jgi:hypothetical protein
MSSIRKRVNTNVQMYNTILSPSSITDAEMIEERRNATVVICEGKNQLTKGASTNSDAPVISCRARDAVPHRTLRDAVCKCNDVNALGNTGAA